MYKKSELIKRLTLFNLWHPINAYELLKVTLFHFFNKIQYVKSMKELHPQRVDILKALISDDC